jgi:membrane protein DedA with SNARE-associated domain
MPFEIDHQQVIAFVQAHHAYAPLIVFLMSLGETIVIVSIFIPSTILLFGVGGLLAASGVPLMPSLIAGGLGAALGFSVMYLVSVATQERLLTLWPFRNYPDTMEKAKAFSRRWGAPGVAIGHFAGPIRVLVPIVAGLSHMRPVPFMLANMAGAAAWIVTFFAPGYLVVSSEWFRTSFSGWTRFF